MPEQLELGLGLARQRQMLQRIDPQGPPRSGMFCQLHMHMKLS